MSAPQQSPYDTFYSQGGWNYSSWYEKRFLKRRIVRPLNLSYGLRLLELGCGMGIHSKLFSDLGFDVVGVDSSAAGIEHARRTYRGPQFLHLDGAMLSTVLAPASFDVVFIRGMSWYHYELNGVNKEGVDVPARTAELFHFLKKSGLFVLQIQTDFSGRAAEDGVLQNRFDGYVGLFRRFGEVVYISDWSGNLLDDATAAQRSGNNIIIATRK